MDSERLADLTEELSEVKQCLAEIKDEIKNEFEHGKISNIEIELQDLSNITSQLANIESSILKIQFDIEKINGVFTNRSIFDFLIKSLILALFIGISVAFFLHR